MNANSLQLGLIGYPLGHSLSPQMHRAALAALALAGDYRLYPIPPLPEGQAELEALLTRLRRGGLAGLNVTIPHKQNVLPLLDELTPLARWAGSANTLYFRDGKLIGDTTDIPGFLADLAVLLPGERAVGGRALILGAGGSARAAAAALGQAGWQVLIAARRAAQAEELAKSLHIPAQIVPFEAGELGRLERIDLLVNTTPLGMFPKPEGCPWPAGLALPEGAAVYDLVYNPPETSLLRQAQQAGHAARNGLGMLVEQGALSLECWSGRRVPRAPMWEAVK
jgi:shikimate dehydrogenase